VQPEPWNCCPLAELLELMMMWNTHVKKRMLGADALAFLCVSYTITCPDAYTHLHDFAFDLSWPALRALVCVALVRHHYGRVKMMPQLPRLAL
jgi:hypothetical protein